MLHKSNYAKKLHIVNYIQHIVIIVIVVCLDFRQIFVSSAKMCHFRRRLRHFKTNCRIFVVIIVNVSKFDLI